MFRFDSLAVVSMVSFAILWAATVAAAPRRDREGASRWDLICIFAGTMLAYASASLPVFLAGWILTIWPYWRGDHPGPRLAIAFSAVPLAIASVLLLIPGGADLTSAAFGAMVLAVLLRKGVFPLHWWTLDAFDQLRLPALGLLLNSHLGGYLLIRFVIPEFPALSAQWLPNLSYLALGTSVLMAIAGLAEARPRRLLGLLWLSQSAFVLAGLATKTEEGITGSLVHWWVVSMATTGMISVYRSVEARTSSAGRTGGFQGLGAHAPRLAVYFAVCGLALVGLPGTLGFVAEDLLFHGALKAHPLLGVALPLATALNAITVLRLFSSIFLGRRAIHVPPIPDALPAERLAFTALIVLLVAGGLMPAVLIALRTPAAAGLARLLAGS